MSLRLQYLIILFLRHSLYPSFDSSASTTDEALSRSFRDAITATKFLGIEYIWIGSLCIVQDSTEDWCNESAMMPSIHGNSYFTIAASAAEDGYQGHFDRAPAWLLARTIGKRKFHIPDSHTVSLHMRQCPKSNFTQRKQLLTPIYLGYWQSLGKTCEFSPPV